MSEISYIRNLYFEKGKKISEISRETGKDRKTVKLYIEKDNWNQESPKAEVNETFLKLEPYKKDIDEWLNEDKKAKKKQRHTAKRVYNRLSEIYNDDFNCSYRTVAGYVSMRKKEIFGKNTGYLPLEHIPGEAQIDFGDADFYENGTKYSGKYLNISFPYSNKGYFQLFKGENQECLFEGMIAIFNHIGGVPIRLWFDNASTIVTKILKYGNRNLTDAFIRFKEHYRFESAFCNSNSGHEKGNVEGKVGYHRRNMLVPVPKFNNFADYNLELLKKCDEDAKREHYRKNITIEELHKEDKADLLVLPTIPLDVCKYISVKTNDYGRFYLENGNHEYSVSPEYGKTRIRVKITASKVIPLDDSLREIVIHDRLYGNYKQQSMKWLPYLKRLSRCPGALKYTGIYKMLPDTIRYYLNQCDKSGKGLVLKMISTLTEMSGFDCALNTVNNALNYQTTDPDSLLSLHKRLYSNIIEFPVLKSKENIPELDPVISNIKVYDKNLKEEQS